ncbi:MAG: HlyD family efflux transporter periplasmic adaptor subunit [Lachnospiraceae bacterium]|nr:HlyD family efflux transporter periplasmic adaptor subunit [Lachnospiraceae bacterium]
MYEIEDKERREPYQQGYRGRKDWIKNLAIIFLSIMLVLTFFSNTIMNYSLPQVATQYVQQGDISPKVRGSGVAEVEDPYSVKVPNARVIKNVNVMVGDTVKKDDVLFELEDQESEELKQARQDYEDAKSSFQKALYSGELTNEAVERIRNGEFLTEDEMQERLDAANSNYNSAVSDDMEAGLEVERLGGGSDTSGMGSTQAAAVAAQDARKLAQAQAYKAETEARLTKATNSRDTTIKSIQAELELKSIKKTMDEAKEKIEKLEKQEKGATVKTPVAGTVTSVTYSIGDTTSADTAGAVIQQEGKGMTVSFTCTKEQAQTLKVGEEAKPQNEWAYTEFSAKLLSITADPSDSSGSKILKFEIQSPDVEPGDNVQLSVGANSKSYDLTVPNSAIREDNNGKFILIVSSRESPLGNRYIATRVDVQVLDSDELLTAISGSLSGYEYVITTATKPVSAGMQVRLAEDVQQ